MGSAKYITKDQVDPTICLLYQLHKLYCCELSDHCAYNTKGLILYLTSSQSGIVDVFNKNKENKRKSFCHDVTFCYLRHTAQIIQKQGSRQKVHSTMYGRHLLPIQCIQRKPHKEEGQCNDGLNLRRCGVYH